MSEKDNNFLLSADIAKVAGRVTKLYASGGLVIICPKGINLIKNDMGYVSIALCPQAGANGATVGVPLGHLVAVEFV